MALDLTSLANLGLPEIMLWLLSFAVVYGVLSQVGEGVPKNRESRAIIGIVAAFFVLFSAPSALLAVLTKMSSSLILVVLGVLVLMIFIEIAGLKHREFLGINKETGKPVYDEIKLFTKHSYILFIVFIIIAILIFMGAGGLALLGFPALKFTQQGMMSIIFFIVVILAIMWMITEGGKKDQKQ